MTQQNKQNQLREIDDMLAVLSDSSSIKDLKPKNFYDQVKIEDDGTNRALWVYVIGHGWTKVALT